MVVFNDTSLQKNELLKRTMHHCIVKKQVHNPFNNILNCEEQMHLQVHCSLFSFRGHQLFVNSETGKSRIVTQVIYRRK